MKYIFTLIKYCYSLLPKKSQKKLEATMKLSDINEQMKIEFSNGEVIKVSNIETCSNMLTYPSYRNFFLKTASQIFKLTNLIILTLLIVIIADNHFDSQTDIIIFNYSLVCFLIDVLLIFGMNCVPYYYRYRHLYSINNQKIIIFKHLKQLDDQVFSEINWHEVRIGDIVCVSRGQECPADLLILDSSCESLSVDYQMRYPCQATFIPLNYSQKGIMIDFKINLNGTIQFDQSLHGTIKLKNDPKATQFGHSNMFYRGEKLDMIDWIFGMAIVVGKDCSKLQKTDKEKISGRSEFTKSQYKESGIFLLIYILFIVILIVFDTRTQIGFVPTDYAQIGILLLSYRVYMSILTLIQTIQQIIRYNKELQIKMNKKLSVYDSYKSSNATLGENDQHILVQCQKMEPLPIVKRGSESNGYHTLRGIQPLSHFQLMEVQNVDLMVIESPEKIFKNEMNVYQIVVDSVKYVINYQALQEHMQKIKDEHENRYSNSDKILINTAKTDLYDEDKPLDLEILLKEKKTPALRQVNEKRQVFQSLKKDSSIGNASILLSNKSSDQKYHPFASFRKQSARHLILSTNKLSDGDKPQSSASSPRISAKKQSSFRFPKTTSKFSQMQIQHSQGGTPTNQKSKELLSSDRLLGDVSNELDFLEKLFSYEDCKFHEILVMMLLCNNLQSYYNLNKKKVIDLYGAPIDQSVINFAQSFDYHLFHNSVQENFRDEYIVKKITKRSIQIQGHTKVYEILSIFQPTPNRPNSISVLIRDPESFLLEEGALLYSRHELTPNNQQSFQLNHNLLNECMTEIQNFGGHCYLYTKKQLTESETINLLKHLDQPYEFFYQKMDELEEYYRQFEFNADLAFMIGVKQPFDAEGLNENVLVNQHIFNTLSAYRIKHLIISETNFEDLTIFIRNYQLSANLESILHLDDNDIKQLQFKFRQQINYLIEDQQILNTQIFEAAKYIIMNEQAFKLILQDDYLKQHFGFIVHYSSGIAIYGFNSKSKGDLIKLLKVSYNCIVSTGYSRNNSHLFYQSDFSFGIKQGYSKPSFIVQKPMEIFKLIFYLSQKLQVNFITIISAQIYKFTCVALIYFILLFYRQQFALGTFILFYLLIGNAINIAAFYPNMVVSDNFLLQDIEKIQVVIAGFKYTRQLISIIFIAIFDILVCFTISSFNIEFFFEGQQNYSICLVLMYVNVEIIEKIRIIFDNFQNNQITLKQSVCILVGLILSIFLYQLTVSQQFGLPYDKQYSSQSIFMVFSNIILLIPTKLVYHLTLQSLNIQVNCFEAKIEEDSTIMRVANLLNDNSKNIKRQQNKLKQLINIIDKQILDEQLSKQLMGNHDLALDKMQKTLKFNDPQVENDYQLFLYEQRTTILNQIIVFICFELMTVAIKLYLDIVNSTTITDILIILLLQFAVQLILLSLITLMKLQKESIRYISIFSFMVRFIFKIITDLFLYRQIGTNSNFLNSILYYLSMALIYQQNMNLLYCFILFGIYMIVEIIIQAAMISYTTNEIWFISSRTFIITLHLVICLFMYSYRLEYLLRYFYIFKNKLLQEQKKLNDTLGLLMPRFIKERMTKGQISISEDQGDVSILFCDICDFDNIILAQEEKIVDFLDNLFRLFDQLCQSNDLQKIETVGKTYMAAAGLRDYDIVMNQKHQNSTQRVLETAIGMMDIAKNLKYGTQHPLVLKIGIHHGRVIAGVIGAHKPQFSLIGDTVNTTSRVCSTGESGFITLSQQAFLRVSHLKYKFMSKDVQAKGKGMMTTYKTILTKKPTRIMEPLVKVSSVGKLAQFKLQQQKSNESNPPQKKQFKKLIRVETIRESQRFSPKIVMRELQQQRQMDTQRNDQDFDKLLGGIVRVNSKSVIQMAFDPEVINNNHLGVAGVAEDFANRKRSKNVSRKATIMRKETIKEVQNNVSPAQLQQPTTTNIQQMQESGMPFGNIKLLKSVVREAHSASKKSPSSQQPDQVQIVKQQNVLNMQTSLNQEFISQLMKYKVDSYSTIEKSEVEYQNSDHEQYYSIYEGFKDSNPQVTKVLLLNTVYLVVISLMYFIIGTILDDTASKLIVVCICQFPNLILVLMVHKKYFSIKILVACYLISSFVISLVQLSFTKMLNYETILQVTQQSSIYLSVFQLQIFNKKEVVHIQFLFVTYLVVILSYGNQWIIIIFYSIGLLGMTNQMSHQRISQLIKNYEIYTQFETQQNKQISILQHMLPTHVIIYIIQILSKFISDQTNTESFTDVFDQATILFADIAGFTKYSSSVQPEQVVTMLRSLFTNFDTCCQELNVYKLYTIGDCYVCMGIIDANNRDFADEAINVTIFGLKMIEIINNVKKNAEFQHLNMRIGVHTGKIIGGVVGTDVVRYDIYGEDVSIANKMESNGTEGKIMVSEETKRLLEENTEDLFNFEYATTVTIPHRNRTINGYFVSFEDTQEAQ